MCLRFVIYRRFWPLLLWSRRKTSTSMSRVSSVHSLKVTMFNTLVKMGKSTQKYYYLETIEIILDAQVNTCSQPKVSFCVDQNLSLGVFSHNLRRFPKLTLFDRHYIFILAVNTFSPNPCTPMKTSKLIYF